jgi:hypothetical protein
MIQIPAAAAAALIEYAGRVLHLDPSDVESVDFSDARDPIELPSDDGFRHYELGPQRVTITINMKPGARAAWIDKE